jgi:hypothetical protein
MGAVTLVASAAIGSAPLLVRAALPSCRPLFIDWSRRSIPLLI